MIQKILHNNIVRLISRAVTVAVGISLFTAVLSPVTTMAIDSKSAVCEGAGLVNDVNTGCTTPVGSPTSTVESTVKTGLNIFSAVTGIIAVVMIMIAGVKYMTSGGDPGKTASAQNTILYAGVGIVVVVLAQVIVKFVLARFTT